MTSASTYRYVALLDILGYRKQLDKDKMNGTELLKEKLLTSNKNIKLVLQNNPTFTYESISDTVILTCNKQESLLEFLKVLKDVQIIYLKENLFVRGGLSYSTYFKEENVTYSHALTSAYKLEHEFALYPRIIVDKNIIDMFKAAGEIKIIIDAKMICEQNGNYFLNILDSTNWIDIFTAAKVIFETDKSNLTEKDFQKHIWFENYLFSSPHYLSGQTSYIPKITIL